MLPAKNTLFWVKLQVGIKNMCVSIKNCNPKGRRKIKRWCQKELLKHNGRVKSNKCSRTAADLTQPKVYLSPLQMFNKYTTNINIKKSFEQHCSFAFPGH